MLYSSHSSSIYCCYRHSNKANHLKRQYCLTCQYPASTCICQTVEELHCPLDIVLLQHPQEAKNRKNSARLIPLCMPNARIVVGESARDFELLLAELRERKHECCVFYPSHQSQSFENELTDFHKSDFKTWIFLDATWRKALKMWHLNPWLHSLPSWHFSSPPSSQYQIRSTKLKDALSTLEAVAYGLQTAQKLDVSALMVVFNAMQSKQLEFIQAQDIKNIC